MDLMVTGESPSEVSDKIKEILYAKAAERVENLKPNAANSLFAEPEEEGEVEDQIKLDPRRSNDYNPIVDSGTTLASASGTSSQSSAMAVKTDSLRITNNGTRNVNVAIGTNPTATANDYSISSRKLKF